MMFANNDNLYIIKSSSFDVQFTVEEWKRLIVNFFVFSNYVGSSYRITNEAELFKQFADNFESNTQTAYKELFALNIIKDINVNGKTFYTLNFAQKSSEIESIIQNEPFEEKSNLIKPTDKEFKNLREEFKDASSRGFPNRGFYYFCTKIDDPNYWVVLIKTKPNLAPYRIILGSMIDENSRIMKIWSATLKVSRINKGKPFIRKWVENIEQQDNMDQTITTQTCFSCLIKKISDVQWKPLHHIYQNQLKPRPRNDDRTTINGIFFVLSTVQMGRYTSNTAQNLLHIYDFKNCNARTRKSMIVSPIILTT